MRPIALLATVVLTAGCYATPAELAPAPQGGGRPTPLGARLIADFRGVPAFLLDEPAWVTVFDVTPGQPVAQVFPMSGFDRVYPQMAGLTPARYAYTGGNRIAFPIGLAATWGYWSTFGPFTSMRVGGQPRHLLMVAARRPLRLPARTFSASWLRDVTGVRYNLTSAQQEAVAQRLFDAVVPPDLDAERDVATDYLVVWDQPQQSLASEYVYLRCANGQFVVVPLWWYVGVPSASLPGVARCQAQVQPPGAPTDSTAPDSTARRRVPPTPGSAALIRTVLADGGGASDEVTSRWGTGDSEASRRVEDLTIDPYSRARHTGIRETSDAPNRTIDWTRRDDDAPLRRAGAAGGVATGGGWHGGGVDRRIEPRGDQSGGTSGNAGTTKGPVKSDGGGTAGELPTVRPPQG
jgi:hypothetical protein